MQAPNLVNLEAVSKGFGTRTLLDSVSLGVGRGERVGVVGRNGDGKSTLLQLLARRMEPDGGRITQNRDLRLGYLGQSDDLDPAQTVLHAVLGDVETYTWAADPRARSVMEHLLGEVDHQALVGSLSGGERRRASLARLLLTDVDLLVLDEPTNHLDIEAVSWLAGHVTDRAGALIVVTHDRWFLDAVCTVTWEVQGGRITSYDGGYAAYVLAKAERARTAQVTEAKRQNLLNKELAWLRRGAPARTSKPKFRIEAANALIANEPPPRDKLALSQLATARLGKDVFDVEDVSLSFGDRTMLDRVTFRLGPADRIGLLGPNGAGKTTFLKVLTGQLAPDRGLVKQGKTVRVANLSQTLEEIDGSVTVLDHITAIRRTAALAGRGGELTSSQLLERFGFTGDKLTTRISDLSGGERRRLQLLRILLDEPNVLILDEPTNDLDVETLTVLEDFLDGWPGVVVTVTHDRYFLERVSDMVYAIMGDGRVRHLPRGVEQYLDELEAGIPRRPASNVLTPATAMSNDLPGAENVAPIVDAAAARAAKKELNRIERQLAKLTETERKLHDQLAVSASDYARLAELDAELRKLADERGELETAWFEAAERAE
ncbi:ABC-F family ATP-binding cassette domain-containing protein [Kribbella solani]|uniref:ABC-F family ATP-binding cassette domain-containing protein n=1 Tax=Kribbella solani TaxID=236067 RepID=UPI0029B65DD7|nr:ABC-F family ATP-binding cassette domain-containing protein [Kribbella solani]MDX2972588.1 ABC-F family ATP-binding cassette domain-containing protein [Kribbella solani]MDX3004177.1 ABC-F family ATP-binding cassette domain-containing protein [Kribbella solani]